MAPARCTLLGLRWRSALAEVNETMTFPMGLDGSFLFLVSEAFSWLPMCGAELRLKCGGARVTMLQYFVHWGWRGGPMNPCADLVLSTDNVRRKAVELFANTIQIHC